MEYDPLNESQRLHREFNESIRSGDISVINTNTLQYADGKIVTSQICNYLFDEENGEYYRAWLNSREYHQKYGKGIIQSFKNDK